MTKCVTQGHEVSKRCREMVPIDLLQAGRNKPSICKKKKKCSKVKHNKTRYACTCKREPLKICHCIRCRAKNGIILGMKFKIASQSYFFLSLLSSYSLLKTLYTLLVQFMQENHLGIQPTNPEGLVLHQNIDLHMYFQLF